MKPLQVSWISSSVNFKKSSINNFNNQAFNLINEINFIDLMELKLVVGLNYTVDSLCLDANVWGQILIDRLKP